MAEERLQKILANAGIASRRKAEDLIVSGHVSVNGVTVTELGSKADLAVDEVKCDGQRLKAPKNYVYFAFNKPKNVMTTVNDPERRETVMHFFKGLKERIYPVGRLDYASEGLLLLTNDGEFANLISSPSAHIPKTYLVKVNGILTADQQETFRRGIPMHGKRTAPAKLKVVRSTVNPWYEVTIAEGRQNQIRIMFKHFGFLVEKLRRIKIGFLDLAGLKGGAYRTLTREEVERFRRMLKMDTAETGKTAGQSETEPEKRESERTFQPSKRSTGERPPSGMQPPSRPSRPSGGSRPSERNFQNARSTEPSWRGVRGPAREEREGFPPAGTRNAAGPTGPQFRGPRPPMRPGRDTRSADRPDRGARPPARNFRDSGTIEPPARGARGPRGPEHEGAPSTRTRNAAGAAGPQFRGPRPPMQTGRDARSAGQPDRGGRPPVRNFRDSRSTDAPARGSRGPEREGPPRTRDTAGAAGPQFRGRPPMGGSSPRAPFRREGGADGKEQSPRNAKSFGQPARGAGPPARNFKGPSSSESFSRNPRPPRPAQRNSRPNTMRGRKPEHE